MVSIEMKISPLISPEKVIDHQLLMIKTHCEDAVVTPERKEGRLFMA